MRWECPLAAFFLLSSATMSRLSIALSCSLLTLHTLACDDGEAPPGDPPAEAPAADPSEQADQPPPDPDEACGQIIVVSYEGAKYASDDITRNKEAAKVRAEQLLQRINAGEDFAAVAEQASDAPSSSERGGVMGTFAKDEWPELHADIRDTVYALQVNQVAADVVDADYGYTLVRRCPVEKIGVRHILVRYEGAKNAPEDITRSREEAQELAREVLARTQKEGADFAAIAKEASEDASAERGGDLGNVGRGLLALPFEKAAFALDPAETSDIVETEYGFHIIQRTR